MPQQHQQEYSMNNVDRKADKSQRGRFDKVGGIFSALVLDLNAPAGF